MIIDLKIQLSPLNRQVPLTHSEPPSTNDRVMQSLWSRAAQAHCCGCRSCSTAVGALGRRATAGARRKPTFAEVFTACYSSVFATAALVDAVRKEDRRRELDRQLDEARRDLADLQERGQTNGRDADTIPEELSINQMDNLWRSLKLIYTNRPYMKEIDKPATVSASELIDTLKREHYLCPDEVSLKATRRFDYERLERAIVAEESDERILHREPRTQLQLYNEALSTEQLVKKLMQRADFLPNGSSSCPSLDEARQMVDAGYPSFTFRSIDPARATKNTALLNRRLRSLINAPNLCMKERIGRVCYNLLVSAHPPDMHTYNTLIVAFNKAGHHTFAEALVSSFFHDRLLKPTPSTFVAILNHYKNTNNHGKFLRALSCLTGLDAKTGAKIRRRHIQDVEMSPVIRQWAADTRSRTQTGDWVWEHVPLNQPLVEEVIGGLLHFKLFDQAATFFVSCMRTGVNLSTQIVRQLLDDCISALDWRAAVRLIRGFTSCPQKWQRLLLPGDDGGSFNMTDRIRVLLDLCGLQGPPDSFSKPLLANLGISGSKLSHFLKVLEKEQLSQYSLLTEDFDNLRLGPNEGGIANSKSRVLQLESLWKEYVFVRKSTASIESKLLYPGLSFDLRCSMAMHIGDAASERSTQLSQEFMALVSGQSSHGNVFKSHLALDQCRAFEEVAGHTLNTEGAKHHHQTITASLDDAKETNDVSAESGELMPFEEVSRHKSSLRSIHSHAGPLGVPGPGKSAEARLAGAGVRSGRLLAWPVSGERAVYAPERQWGVGA